MVARTENINMTEKRKIYYEFLSLPVLLLYTSDALEYPTSIYLIYVNFSGLESKEKQFFMFATCCECNVIKCVQYCLGLCVSAPSSYSEHSLCSKCVNKLAVLDPVYV